MKMKRAEPDNDILKPQNINLKGKTTISNLVSQC